MTNIKRLKEGNKAVLVRALGKRNGNGPDAYYHRMGTYEIPFGTVVTVKSSILKNRVSVKDGTGKSFLVHQDEIKLVKPKIEVLPGIERLERHPLFEMSDSTPLVVADGKVYAIHEQSSGEALSENRFTQKRLFSSPLNYSLTEIGTLSSLEETHLDRNEKVSSAMKRAYSQQISREWGLEARLGKLYSDKTVIAIAEQVFPYLTDKLYQEKLLSALEGNKLSIEGERKVKGAPTALERLTAEFYHEASILREQLNAETLTGRGYSHIFNLSTKSSEKNREIIYDVVGSSNFMISKGRIFNLHQTDSSTSRKLVTIDGKNYQVSKFFNPFRKQEEDYQKLFSQELKKSTLEEQFSQVEIKNFLRKKLGNASEFMDTDENSEGEFGISKTYSGYYIWLRVPQFAIKSQFDRQCYLFESSKVGVKVNLDEGGRVRSTYQTCMVKNNQHPLTQGNFNYASICFGHNSFAGGLYGESVVKGLRQAKEIVMKGYKGKHISLFSCRRLGKCPACEVNHYEDKMVSERELAKRGIPIFDGLVKDEYS